MKKILKGLVGMIAVGATAYAGYKILEKKTMEMAKEMNEIDDIYDELIVNAKNEEEVTVIENMRTVELAKQAFEALGLSIMTATAIYVGLDFILGQTTTDLRNEVMHEIDSLKITVQELASGSNHNNKIFMNKINELVDLVEKGVNNNE